MYIIFLSIISLCFCVDAVDELRSIKEDIHVLGILYSQETDYFGEGRKYRGIDGTRGVKALSQKLYTIASVSQIKPEPSNFFATVMISFIDTTLWQKAHQSNPDEKDLQEYQVKKRKLLAVYERYIALKKRAEELDGYIITALCEQSGIPFVDESDIDIRSDYSSSSSESDFW